MKLIIKRLNDHIDLERELRQGENIVFTLFAVELTLAAVVIVLAFIGSLL